MKLRGDLQTQQDLNLLTGNKSYDYWGNIVSSDDTVEPVEFAIDATYFINIAAGKIAMIVTQKGVGVNTSDGDLITDLSTLEITADGDLVLKKVESATDVKLTSHSGSISHSESIKANRNISINAKTYSNESQDVIAQNDLNIHVETLNNNGGQFGAKNNVTINADTFNNQQNSANEGGLVYAGNNLNLNVEDVLNNDFSTLYAGIDVFIKGNSNAQVNLFTNKVGTVEAGHNVNITAVDFKNLSQMYDPDGDGYFGFNKSTGNEMDS
jgi:adhesin HecA-like repeat protein